MLLYYLQNNIISLILLCSISLFWSSKRLAIPSAMDAFEKLIGTTIVMCLSDMLAWYSNGATFATARSMVMWSNIIYYLSITFISFYWMKYVNAIIRPASEIHPVEVIVSDIALVIITALILSNPLTDFFFSIDEANFYHREAGVTIHWIFSWGFLIWSTILVLNAMFKAKTPLLRKQYLPMLGFIVLPAIAALTQMFLYSISTMQCGITLSLVIIAVDYLKNQIVRDPLTGLNNRKSLDEHINSLLENAHGTNLFVCMIDVDSFKQINDRYGHSEGDIALKSISNAIKQAINSCNGRLFLCRYGGDEFLVCGTDLDEGKTYRDLKHNIDKNLSNISTSEYKGYSFGVSIGTSSGLCKNYADIEKLIVQADENMYKEKNSKKDNTLVSD